MDLTGKQRRALKGLGHRLKPLVMVGRQGKSEALIQELDACLLAHELVKVKVLEGCPVARDELGAALAEATGGALVQKLGRTLLLYRPHPEDPAIELPAAETRP